MGMVPKKEPNNLSYPLGGSVNDAIDPALCAVSYASFDKAVSWVRKFGRGYLLAKTDIEAAFRVSCPWVVQFFALCLKHLACLWNGLLGMFRVCLLFSIRDELRV